VLDRNYPIEVCAKCHNGYYDDQNKKAFVDEGKPNCTSCHVQHYYDKYRWGDLLVDKSRDERLKSIDDKAVESIVKPPK
jgi:formate-dependent nitrite reductase cytochrome c552 subunit